MLKKGFFEERGPSSLPPPSSVRELPVCPVGGTPSSKQTASLPGRWAGTPGAGPGLAFPLTAPRPGAPCPHCRCVCAQVSASSVAWVERDLLHKVEILLLTSWLVKASHTRQFLYFYRKWEITSHLPEWVIWIQKNPNRQCLFYSELRLKCCSFCSGCELCS